MQGFIADVERGKRESNLVLFRAEESEKRYKIPRLVAEKFENACVFAGFRAYPGL